MSSCKRKFTVKSVKEKCNAIKDIERGLSNKDVAIKYGVPKNTVSTWVKNKAKLLKAIEGGSNSKRQKIRSGDFNDVDTTVYKWFISKRSQNIPIDGVLLKEKAMQYAKELGHKEFMASDGWLRRWKER